MTITRHSDYFVFKWSDKDKHNQKEAKRAFVENTMHQDGDLFTDYTCLFFQNPSWNYVKLEDRNTGLEYDAPRADYEKFMNFEIHHLKLVCVKS